MSVGLNASQARAKSQQDMVIYDEVQTIMKEIITQSNLGNFAAIIDDGTTMTESTPSIDVVGTVANPTVIGASTFIIENTTVTLGTTGLNLNSVIADINDAAITGITASKNTAGNLVITVDAQASTVWDYTIGAGTANANLGFTQGTYVIPNPSSTDYYDVWQGTATDRGKNNQMEQVIRHFQNLGYKIERTVNINTNSTLQWNIYW